MATENKSKKDSGLVGVSNVFVRGNKNRITLNQYKTLIYALSQIKWTQDSSEYIYVKKKDLALVLGLHSDPRHLSGDLFNEIKDLPTKSHLEISAKDLDMYVSGVLISDVTRQGDNFRIHINPTYMPLFTNLQKDYITLYAQDIYGMNSLKSTALYERLRLSSDTRVENTRIFSTKELKTLFNLPKAGRGSYMRANGGFDRSNFEKKVLDVVCEDLAGCKMITLKKQGDKFYKKIVDGKVMGYEFVWTVSDRPNVATGEEIQKVTENPVILKIANDMLNKTKPKKTAMANTNTYDFEELERQLLKGSSKE